MKKLKYDTLEINEFGSIKELTVDLNRVGNVWFVFGENKVEPEITSNGCGKTTIFNALCWVQFGKTVRGLRNPDIIPWSGGAPFVRLVYSIDGQRHEIQRHANPNSLMLDGCDIDQAALERHLGFNYETLLHTILLGQEKPLFLDKTPSEKLKLFSDALELERWDQRSKDADGQADQLRREIDREDGSLTRMAQQWKEVKELHENTKRQAADWTAQQEAVQGRLKKELKEAEKFVEQLQRRHDDASLAYDGACTELKPLARELSQQQDYLRTNEAELVRAEERLNIALTQRKELKVEIIAAKRGQCPTCGQPWRHKGHIKDLENQLADLEDRCSARVQKPAANLNRQLKATIKTLDESHQKFTRQAEEARDILDSVIPRLSDLKSQISRLKTTRQQYEDSHNPFYQQLKDLKQRRVKLATEYKQLTSAHKAKKERLERVVYWVKGFKDIKLYIIEETLQELRLCSDAILIQLGLHDWSLEFDVEKETQKGTVQRGLNAFVHSPYNDKPVKWECWGGGESQRLRIAGSLALGEVLLNRAGVDPSIEILDEPTRGLSKKGTEDLVEFLALRARQLDRAIFFVDQNVIESSQFAGTMHVTRTTDGTYIDE